MSRLASDLFYFLQLFVILIKLPFVITRDYSTADFHGAAWFLNYTNSPGFFVIGIALLSVLASAWCLVRPATVARIAAAFLFAVVCYAPFSFGKMAHSSHMWMIAAFAMVFFKSEKSYAGFNSRIVELIQVIILASYLTAALWKVRSWMAADAFSAQDIILHNVAYAIAQGNGPAAPVLDILESHGWLLTAGFAMTVLFQISAFIPILIHRYREYWGWMAFSFHLMTGLFMGIWFNEHSVAALYFLAVVPKLDNYVSKEHS